MNYFVIVSPCCSPEIIRTLPLSTSQSCTVTSCVPVPVLFFTKYHSSFGVTYERGIRTSSLFVGCSNTTFSFVHSLRVENELS